MKKIYVGLIIVLSSAFVLILNNADAAEPVKLVFDGQKIDQLYYYDKVELTRYRTEQVDSICSREVFDYTENVCSTYTDYEEQCSSTPSRTVCTDSPGRQVCSTSGTREVCGTNPRSGETVCNTVGGHQSCIEVGGGESCSEEGGGTFCRDVPVTRESCSDVDRYRTETYACIKDVQIPYNVKVTVENKIDFEFVSESKEKIEFEYVVKDQVLPELKVSENASKAIVVVLHKDISRVDKGENFKLETKYIVKILDLNKLPPSLNTLKVSGFYLERKYDTLSFQISGKLEMTEVLNIVINDSAMAIDLSKLKSDATLKNSVRVKVTESGKTNFSISLKTLGLVNKLGWLKKYDINLTLEKDIFQTRDIEFLSGAIDYNAYKMSASIENLKARKN